MVKIIVTLLIAFALQAALGPRVEAQSSSCNIFVSECPICGDMAWPGQYDCSGWLSALSIYVECKVPAWWCVPPDAAAETAPKCDCDKGSPSGGSPINLANGDTFIIDTDLSIPGLGGGLSLTRQWNSLWPVVDSAYQIGMFGPNWRSTYEERVFVGSDHYFKYLRSDGSIWSFGYGPGKPVKFESAFMMLATPVGFGQHGGADKAFGGGAAAGGGGGGAVYITPSYFSIHFGDGTERNFDINTGKLIGIVDRNGNVTAISYDSNGRISTVTDSASRHLYFSYGSGNASLCTSVTSDFGVSLSYSYDDQGRLVQVTKPDLTTISYQYNAQSLITSVLDSDGKVLETHTYDSNGRGLTSSRANGIDSITLSYQ